MAAYGHSDSCNCVLCERVAREQSEVAEEKENTLTWVVEAQSNEIQALRNALEESSKLKAQEAEKAVKLEKRVHELEAEVERFRKGLEDCIKQNEKQEKKLHKKD